MPIAMWSPATDLILSAAAFEAMAINMKMNEELLTNIPRPNMYSTTREHFDGRQLSVIPLVRDWFVHSLLILLRNRLRVLHDVFNFSYRHIHRGKSPPKPMERAASAW
eukprot:NODE_1099_length_1004_cov_182.409424_g912_i0.p1 GENE.NODE_1099_length_1004_cov_182.409424_g912_i0~~NODE_1099_length_1004_cov_182.409424_g912_i0.p1  ORF type:complete len:108 (+),score=4.67 NODE_1099_length_1004_cov_182.409424_g912_i0:591-914(+)